MTEISSANPAPTGFKCDDSQSDEISPTSTSTGSAEQSASGSSQPVSGSSEESSASGSSQPVSGSSEESSCGETAKPLINQQPLLRLVLQTSATINWTPMEDITGMDSVKLSHNVSEFIEIRDLFMGSTKSYFEVVDIERVQNPHLMALYSLRKEEMSLVLGKPVTDELLFHGTKTETIDEICRKNFNWRLHGKSIGNRFGRGVSFSKISYYASHYCDKEKYCVRKMIVAKVIIGKCCIGNGIMMVPTSGCDTSMKTGGKDVIVKYQDDEFYPAYVITYRLGTRNGTRKYKGIDFGFDSDDFDVDDDIVNFLDKIMSLHRLK